MESYGYFALALLLSYLVGSIPAALIAGHIIGGYDIRTEGSGNAGATNIYRLFGVKPYIIVLAIDVLKGAAAVLFIAAMGYGVISDTRTELLCGVAAIIGHIWTVFANFRGGKGVATAGGVFLAIAPIPILLAFVAYFLVTLTTQYVSLGSMTAAVTAPVAMMVENVFFEGENLTELIVAITVVAALIIFTHRVNIKRLIKGEEGKTDFLKSFRKERHE